MVLNKDKESISLADCENNHERLKEWAWKWFIAICSLIGFIVVYLISFNVWITGKANANETDIRVIQKENVMKDQMLSDIREQNKQIIELLKGKK